MNECVNSIAYDGDCVYKEIQKNRESFVSQNSKSPKEKEYFEKARKVIVEQKLFQIKSFSYVNDCIRSYPSKVQTVFIKVFLRSFWIERNQILDKINTSKLLMEQQGQKIAQRIIGVLIPQEEDVMSKLLQIVGQDKIAYESDLDGVGLVISSLEQMLSKRKDNKIVL